MTKEVVPFCKHWLKDFSSAQSELLVVFSTMCTRVHHIGSTSVPGMDAKPIIDILVEVIDINGVDARNPKMTEIGYECMGEYGITGRRYFRRMNSQGVRTHHVHVFESGTTNALRHLAFRDYLIAHPAKAREYAKLKKELAVNAKGNWNDYVEGKDPFIKETEKLALAWYQIKQ